MNKAVKEIIEQAKKIEGAEFNFSGDSVEIYWENLRCNCDEKTFDEVFNAIKVLADNVAYFA